MTRQRLPIVMQSEIAECGIACITMVVNYFGTKYTLSDIRKITKSSLKGSTIWQLKQIAQKLGFNAVVLRINLEQLTTLSLPCLIHWRTNHFLVLKEYRKNYILVHDPARGLRKISIEEVNESFTGIILELSPHEERIVKTKPSKRFNLFKKILISNLNSIAKLLIISIAIQCCFLFSIKITQSMIDKISITSSTNILFIPLFAILGIKLMETSCIALRSFLVTRISTVVNQQFAFTIINHLIRLPSAFFENRHLGDVISRFGGIEKIRSAIIEGFVESLVDGLVATITLIAMAYLNLKLTSIILVTSIIYFTLRFSYENKAKQLQEEALYARSYELSNFLETLKAITAIKVFTKEEVRIKSWFNKFIYSLNALTKIAWHKALYDSGKNFILNVDLTLTLMMSCLLLANQQLTLGIFYAVLAYRVQYVTAIEKLGEKLQQYRLLKLHIERLHDLTSEPPELKDDDIKCNKIHHDFKQMILITNNLSYTYTDDPPPLFKDLNLKIQKGECVAITGPSGCGKSTLLKILMGLAPPTSGELVINDTIIYPSHIRCYRSRIAGVLQDDILLSGNIAENISFLDPLMDMERVRYCAQLAGIDDEIMGFPMGFGTLVGDMGSVLSGGQKQRILLARALYAQPEILFLDEASSHLDAKKEYEVNRNLRNLNMTIVMVAHRKETIVIADRIIELAKLIDSTR